jgi:hypothetical protein
VAYPTPRAKRKQTFKLFAYPTGTQGNVVSKGVNELIIRNYKQTLGLLRVSFRVTSGASAIRIAESGIQQFQSVRSACVPFAGRGTRARIEGKN